MRLRAVTLALAIATLTACQSALPPNAQPLTGAEIRVLFVDRTIYGISRTSAQPYTLFYAPDGTMRLVSGGYRDAGRYRIDDDGTMCVRFERFNAGAERCFRLFRDGANVWQVGSDNSVNRADVQGAPGNPQGL